MALGFGGAEGRPRVSRADLQAQRQAEKKAQIQRAQEYAERTGFRWERSKDWTDSFFVRGF